MENGVCFSRGLGRYVTHAFHKTEREERRTKFKSREYTSPTAPPTKTRQNNQKRIITIKKKKALHPVISSFFPIPLNLFFDKQVNNASGFVFVLFSIIRIPQALRYHVVTFCSFDPCERNFTINTFVCQQKKQSCDVSKNEGHFLLEKNRKEK